MAKAKISFYGVRGSMASPGVSTAHVGGNTSCVLIEFGGKIIVCDAGTGIRQLGYRLGDQPKDKPLNINILISHIHWDHYIGLPFFLPLYKKINRITISGPKPVGSNFDQALSKVIRPPYFPVDIKTVPATIKFNTLSLERFNIGAIKVIPFKVNHPGGSFGWRFEFPNNKVLVHVSDNEPANSPKDWQRLVWWMEGADLLIHDAQYSREKYLKHQGWGHSPFTYPLELAVAGGIKHVILYHFDPDDTDKELANRLKEARRILKGTKIWCELAKEGSQLEL